MGFFTALLSFALTIGILVTVHEYGHYWVAKKFNVKILRFSVGFGKVIKSFKRGETEFTLCAIPLGGYVKMLDENEAQVADNDKHRAFNRQSVYKRFAIVLAGPVANFLLAILLYTLIFIIGVNGMKPIIGSVTDSGFFDQAGLQVGDELLSINNAPTPSISEFSNQFIQSNDTQPLVIQARSKLSNLKTSTLNLTGDFLANPEQGLDQYLGFKFSIPKLPAIIDQVVVNSAASKAGLRSQDEVLSANGQSISTWQDFVIAIQAKPIKPIKLLIKRNTKNITLTLTPELINNSPKVGVSVAMPQDYLKDWQVLIQKEPVDAFLSAGSKVYQLTLLNLKMIKKMIIGEASIDQISGPVTIANYAQKSAEIGLVPFLSFLALISIGLGLLNLLPIPLLDGGHLFFYIVEIIKGSPVNQSVQQVFAKLGLFVILSLTFVALYNDLIRLS
ncbi:RIP metalloprotease RseP [Candidatus Thioglobus sp.]|nr:RIP metalloprotease RseP [Candidatus Thioglobus sp.]MDB3893735.1 RIP metalloprotease RseP [Candidatus Thioglobus sp.]MDC0904520.1 RIP metalloprotease RseP [Candidatus Thioglobus sp.]MDC0920734.1 RIP metalloprotease RseP [Candidatus Thioglobus sp.]